MFLNTPYLARVGVGRKEKMPHETVPLTSRFLPTLPVASTEGVAEIWNFA